MPRGIASAVTVAADRLRDLAVIQAMNAVTPTPNDPMPPLRQAFAADAVGVSRRHGAHARDPARSPCARGADDEAPRAGHHRRHLGRLRPSFAARDAHRRPPRRRRGDQAHAAASRRLDAAAADRDRTQVPARLQPAARATAGRRRRGRAMELSVPAFAAACRGGAGGGQPRDDQAVRARAENGRADGAHRAGIVRRGRDGGVPRRCGNGKGLRRSCRSTTCSSPAPRPSAASWRRRPRRT